MCQVVSKKVDLNQLIQKVYGENSPFALEELLLKVYDITPSSDVRTFELEELIQKVYDEKRKSVSSEEAKMGFMQNFARQEVKDVYLRLRDK